MFSLIKSISLKLIILFFKGFFNLLIRLYYFYRGFNDKNFVEVKSVKNYHVLSINPYLLELKDSRFFDKVLIVFKRGQKPIQGRWYDIDYIKYDAKGEVPLERYDEVSLYIKYILKFEFTLFKYKLFEDKKTFELTKRLTLNNIGVKDSKLSYKIVFKE